MKIIKTGEEALQSLKKGIDQVADIVKSTIGPAGKNIVLEFPSGEVIITNDGFSVAREIDLEDETENKGAHIVKEVAKKANDEAGDGTTTATVIAQALFNSAIGGLIRGKPLETNKKIQIECENVIDKLKKVSKPVKSTKDIYKIALVSSESEEIAGVVTEAFDKVGKDGVVLVEETLLPDTKLDIKNGLTLQSGLASKYLADSKDGATMLSPKVLLTNKIVNNLAEISPIISKLHEKGVSNLVIVAEDFSPQILAVLIANKINKGFNVLPIRGKFFFDEERVEDFSAFTGAKYLKDQDLSSTTVEDLGVVAKVVCNSDETNFMGSQNDMASIVSGLQESLKTTESDFDKKKIEERIARLSSGIATISVGTTSEFERSYLKRKYDDTVCAVKSAYKLGYVKGGGLALKAIAEEDKTSVLYEALIAPYNQVQQNSIENTGEPVEIGNDVIDSTHVVITALRSACSVIGKLITTHATIVIKKEKDAEHN